MKKFGLVLFAILLTASSMAQTAPAPAPPLAGSVDPGEPKLIPRYEDNVRPLSGVEDYDVGNRTELFNLLTPTFNFSQSYGTNPGFRTGPKGETVWGSTTSVGGSLQLMRTGTTQRFSMSYKGAAIINSTNSDLNTQIHTLGLSETISAGRWNYVIGNDLSYEPNAIGASAPFLFPGSDSGSGFRPGVSPNDTILTEQNTRLSNTTVGQVSYGLSRASIITGNVSYGILHYTNDDLLDTHQFTSTGSFDHKFGRNTVGVGYTYSKFMFANADENFQTNAVELTYGRRIVGRFSVDIGFGPTFTSLHIGPIASTDVSMNGRANLRYVGTKTNFSFGYSRAVTAGSGITPGALTDSVSGSMQRKLSQTVTANLTASYSRNSGTSSASEFNNYFVNAGVSRDVGRYISLTLGYNGQRQTSGTSIGNLSSHAVVASMQWRFRPVRLQ